LPRHSISISININIKTTIKMAFQPTPQDVSVIITSSAVSRSADSEPRFLTERRITPTWTVEQVKSKLETMTGVPPSSQRLRVKVPGRPDQWADNDAQLIGDYGIVKGSEIEVGLFFVFSFWVCSVSVISWLASGVDVKYHVASGKVLLSQCWTQV
jgi:hypothetical protein